MITAFQAGPFRTPCIISRIFALTFFCLLGWFASAVPATAQQIPFRSYSQADGLSNVVVSCLQQDVSGYMLACTEHGLYAYDGRRFFNLGPQQGLPEGGIVYDLVFGANRAIILRYLHRIFISEQPLSLSNPPGGLTFHAVVSKNISIDNETINQLVGWKKGAIYIAHGHLYYVDPGSPAEEPSIRIADGLLGHPDGPIRDASPIAVQGNSVWVALADGRICALDSRSVRCFGKNEGLTPAKWVVFLAARNGHLLARSTLLLADIDPRTGQVQVTPLPDQGGVYLNYSRHFLLAQTPSGQLITQSADGLMIRNGSGWKMLTTINGLPSAPIVSVLFDQEQGLWLGTIGSGALRALGYGTWENWNHRDGISNGLVWQITRQPGGPIWVASDGGVDAIGPTQNGQTSVRHYDKSSYAVATDDLGHVWRSVGTSGVSCITVATGATVDFALPPVDQILRGVNGRLWFITEDGIYFVDETSSPPVAPTILPEVHGRVTGAKVAADGSLWILRRGLLLHRHTNGSIVSVKLRWPQPDFDPLVMAIAAPDVIWIGGAGAGLYRLDLAGDQVLKISQFRPPDILSNSVVSILVDSRKWVWVGTDSGLSAFNGERWVSVDTGNGLIWDDLDQDSLLEDADGSLWIGTSHGLSHLLEPERLFDLHTLQPVITTVLLGEQRYQNRAVAFSREPLAIQFGALNFQFDGSVRFRYRLEGVDKSWADTASGFARYAFVPPGHHRFVVIAYDPLSHQQSAPISVLIRMKEPWWLWWPLVVLYGALSVAVIYGMWRLRFRFLLRQRRVLQREVELQTREIRAAQEALHLQATQDSLTNLLTRGEIQRRVVEVLERAEPTPHLTIGLLDIDHFKRINDRFGHLSGDEILKEIGQRLNSELRAGEYAGRYGGEELLLVLDIEDAAGVTRIHALNMAACGEPFFLENEMLRVTCSIGVTQVRPSDDWKALIGRADKALYHAKSQGRNRVVEAPAHITGYR